MCKSADHKLRSCPCFLTCTKRNNRCINCLGFGHLVSHCTSAFNCSTCHARHHTLLHVRTVQPISQRVSSTPSDEIPSTSIQAQQSRNFKKSNGKPTTQVQSCFANSDKGVLLGTAQININHNGVTYAARALIDSGSECSFITERMNRRIKLPARKINAQVSGINNTVAAQVKESCCVELRSPIDQLISITTNMTVLPKLTRNLPTCHISALTRQAFPDLTLADKRFFVNEPVDVILGGDVYSQIMLDGIRKNVLGSLLAQETVFGWIFTGRANTIKPTNTCVSYYNEISLEKQLASFWELEEMPKERKLSEEDRYCEELYQKTTSRNEDGKYVVSLPFKKDYPVNIRLGSSLKIAYSQFYRKKAHLQKCVWCSMHLNQLQTALR
uniref:Peptidase aspartic putative domain-containing protein n=1 Tax=Bactrocera latifrons TaxID=174628 RepID=A0A0K8WEU6_BACLA